MTTQELYNKVLAEEVTQQKFLYEVRRDIKEPNTMQILELLKKEYTSFRIIS